MMIANTCRRCALLIALGLLVVTAHAQSKPAGKKKARAKPAAAEATPAPEATPSLEPKAIDILKAASSRLAAARTMKFTAIHFYESPSRQGHPLAFTTKSEVTLQRPDKLRVIMSADGPASEFYYDRTPRRPSTQRWSKPITPLQSISRLTTGSSRILTRRCRKA